jgi:hypothetical protein
MWKWRDTTRKLRAVICTALLVFAMAFAFVTQLPASNTASNQTSTAVTVTNSNFGGDHFLVACIAVDNHQTTDGDEGAVSGITDTNGNTWVKAKEFCNGQGSAQAGATSSLWYTDQKGKSTSGNNTITASFTNSASRDKSVISCLSFTRDTTKSVEVEATGQLADDGGAVTGLGATTANIECLRIRSIASESNSTTNLTSTSSWTAPLSGIAGTTSGGSSAANMALRMEYRIVSGSNVVSSPTLFSADHASVFVAFKEVATGTNYTNNVGGTLTPAGALKRDTSIRKTGTLTPAAVLTFVKTLFRTLTGSVTPSGGVQKAVSTTKTGSIASAATVANFKTTDRSVSGSIGSSGALKRDAANLKAGTIGSSGLVVRTISALKSGTILPSGVVRKAGSTTKTGTIGSSGTLQRASAKTLIGSIASAGAITTVKSLFRTLTGTVALGGVLVKVTAIVRTGQIGASAVLGLIKSKNQALAGSIASSGAVTRSISIFRAGVIASSGLITKAVSKLTAGTIGSSGTASSQAGTSLNVSGQISSTGELSKAASIAKTGNLSPSSNLARSVAKSVSGTIASSATVASLKAFFSNLTGSISSTGTVQRSSARVLTGEVSSSGLLSRLVSLVRSGSIASSGDADSTGQASLSVDGSIVAAGTVSRSANKRLASMIAPLGSIRRTVARIFSGLISSVGNLVTQFLAPVETGSLTVRDFAAARLDISDASLITIGDLAATQLQTEDIPRT